MAENLEELLISNQNLVDLLRNAQVGPNAYPGVPPEFTNWRDEQEAWQKTCILFDLSYHMVDLALDGPDALTLSSSIGFNTFEGFAVDNAKHLAPCSPDGYVIGDVILFYLADQSFNLVGRAPALNWIRYQIETGGYDVSYEWDERTLLRKDKSRRKSYRFQLQGHTALQIVEKAMGAPPAPGEVLPPHDTRHRRSPSPCPAARDGRAARVRTLRSLGGEGTRAGSPSLRRRGIRASSRRIPGLLLQHTGVGLNPR